ncbi:hypothetical protein QBC43DRAFT_12364 [Cladorrhinum sp. PSN259]|nr:hypothetical protein QBC43DRAFT_12364 [Cladorrhinum sp. PSN259]
MVGQSTSGQSGLLQDDDIDPDFTGSFSVLTVSHDFSSSPPQQYSGHEAASSSWPAVDQTSTQGYPVTTGSTNTASYDASSNFNMHHQSSDYASSHIDPALDQYYYSQAAAGPSTQPAYYNPPPEATGASIAEDGNTTDPETAARKPYKCTKCGVRHRRPCDLDHINRKHMHNHSKRRKCPLAAEEGCQWKGGAENKDLHRHLWSHHNNYARANNIPKDEEICDYPGCDYKGRKDNVKRHKDSKGHWLE